MDPNEALKRARAALARLRAADECAVVGLGLGRCVAEAADELADAFEALDGWLSTGGFLPAPWARGQLPPPGSRVGERK